MLVNRSINTLVCRFHNEFQLLVTLPCFIGTLSQISNTFLHSFKHRRFLLVTGTVKINKRGGPNKARGGMPIFGKLINVPPRLFGLQED